MHGGCGGERVDGGGAKERGWLRGERGGLFSRTPGKAKGRLCLSEKRNHGFVQLFRKSLPYIWMDEVFMRGYARGSAGNMWLRVGISHPPL